MYSFKQLQDIINAAVSERTYPDMPGLYDPITYIMNLDGKRLRPCLVLMGCNLFSENIHEAISPALGVELFHNFTLMHDDIMDNAPLRRGAVTVHRKWDANTAILSGDVMLVEAYKLMSRVKPAHLKQILDIFSETAAQVCEGQQVDMHFERLDHVNIAGYMQMIELKTAVLLGTSLKIGAITGGAGKTEAGDLYDFGKNLGIAFQLQDDYLDVYGNPSKFGKRVGGDIISNKKTYMLIKAFELAAGRELETLDKWTQESTFDPDEKVKEVRDIYDSLGIPEKIKAETGLFVDAAFTHLERVAAAPARKKILREFSESLLAREK